MTEHKATAKGHTFPWKPFDVVFFQGSQLMGQTIRAGQDIVLGNGEWTHVGLLIPREMVQEVEQPSTTLTEDWYVWESTFTSQRFAGEETKSIQGYQSGVQFRPFLSLVRHYRYHVAVLRPYIAVSYQTYDWKRLYTKYANVEYDFHPVQLCSSLFRCCRIGSSSSSSISSSSSTKRSDPMFCSEFVANVLKDLHVLPSSVRADHVVPMDFLGYDQDYSIPFAIGYDATTEPSKPSSSPPSSVLILRPIDPKRWDQWSSVQTLDNSTDTLDATKP